MWLTVETAVADKCVSWRGGYKVQWIRQALSFWQNTILPGIRITLEIEYPFSLLHKKFMKILFKDLSKEQRWLRYLIVPILCTFYMFFLQAMTKGTKSKLGVFLNEGLKKMPRWRYLEIEGRCWLSCTRRSKICYHWHFSTMQLLSWCRAH